VGGAFAAAVAWARADVRARWRSLVALGLIGGVAGGLALGCAVGADRTGTALERLQEETAASDAVLFPSQLSFEPPDWSRLAERPEVDAIARWALVFGDLPTVDHPGEELLFAASDDAFMGTVDRPVVVEGRMWDPSADDELVVAEAFARQEGIEVGDTIAFTPFSHADFDDDGELLGGPLTAPPLDPTVVGIIRTPVEALFVAEGLAVLSPGFLAQHPDAFAPENAVVRLRPGEGGVRALQRHADEDVLEGLPLLDLGAVARRVTTTTDVQRTVLLLLGAAIAVAGIVLAGQVVTRSAASVGSDARSLQAMGMARRDVALAATLAHLPAAFVAAGAGAASALALATVLPFGLAGELDPDTGLRADPAITALGTAVVVVLLLAGCWLAAWQAARTRGETLPPEGRGIVDWVRQRSSVVVGLGTTMAFRRTRGTGGVLVRPALVGAVVGVLGVAAAATVDAGLDDALDHPERAGVVWDALVHPGPDDVVDGSIRPDLVAEVQARDGVAGVAVVDRAVVSVGGVGMPGFVTRPTEGGADVTRLAVLEGRGPERAGEIALGPASAKTLDVGPGDRVELADGGALTVVGRVLFPTDVHSGFDDGVWLHPVDYAGLVQGQEAVERFLGVRFSEDARPAAVLEDLGGLVEPTGGAAQPAEQPPELTNLRDVVPLPRWLAAFLAVLALAALLHVLSSSARARAREFAVLRALGVTRRSTRLLLHVQGVAIFLVGLALGIPLGIAAGRVAWRLLAERVPLLDVSPFALLAIALVVPAALLLSQLLAVGPGRRVRRLRPAEVLRSE
jgi:hypothetical protein